MLVREFRGFSQLHRNLASEHINLPIEFAAFRILALVIIWKTEMLPKQQVMELCRLLNVGHI